MNDLIEQFLIECRELVAQGVSDLLAIEDSPDDKHRLGSAFRAFHTLKGAAGIVDFAAMAHALHAAEDALAAARAGTVTVSPQLVSSGLDCLDQVSRWLDSMEVSGEQPAEAEADAEAIVARFAELDRGRHTSDDRQSPPEAGDEWVSDLLARHPQAAAHATVALSYAPDRDSFFRGEDPLALVGNLPELLALDIEPSPGAWPPLDQLDPFACHMVLRALLSGHPDEIEALLDHVRDQLSVKPLGKAAPGDDGDSLPAPAHELLRAQLLLLAERGDGAAGRMGSAGRVAVNVLRYCGRPAWADHLEGALARCRVAGEPGPLVEAIESILAGEVVTGAESAGVQHVAPPSEARTLRIDVDRIEALVKLTGELTVVKNAIGHAVRLDHDADQRAPAAALKDHHAALDRLLEELQVSVTRMRVLPFRHVFQRFPRAVREMAAAMGKSARLEIEGEATEADKAIVEGLAEPLLHLLRNAVDHGVDPAHERATHGKPDVATIRLRAVQDGEHVVVEVADDGRGIDVAAVRRTAAQRKLVSEEAMAAMTDEEAIDLIFLPSFSTAPTVSRLSGRGVGMDAVRTAVERLGGRVRVQSAPRKGATVSLKLPFTIIMTRVMTVETGGQTFGIPLESVVETVCVARDRIVPVGAIRAFVHRNRTVPVIELAGALGRSGNLGTSGEANIVVAEIGGQLGGLEVERFGERMDVMLKPMDGLLSGMPGIAGTTLLGDGRVLVVLKLQEILL